MPDRPLETKINPLSEFGWAFVNSDGSIADQSGNLRVDKGSAGSYTVSPINVNIPFTSITALAINRNGVPCVLATDNTIGHGPNGNGILVTSNLWTGGAAVPTDDAFFIVVWSIGRTSLALSGI